MPERRAVEASGRTRGIVPGHVRIIVPTLAADAEAMRRAGLRFAASDADVLEWRADAAVAAGVDPVALLPHARCAAGQAPLLVTLRSTGQGGLADLPAPDLAALQQRLLEAGGLDLLDVEMGAVGSDDVARVIARAHAAGVTVVGSHHDFTRTPPAGRLVDRLEQMAQAGADIAKIAVMPRRPQDVVDLLQATVTAAERLQPRGVPVITMSMGELGAGSRLTGCTLGSAATFAVLDEVSAPGQLPVEVVARALDALGVRPQRSADGEAAST
ncbi:type I 3-dehydroquinate dehydratase [Brachybacterium sp. EF45031]|uniref:type I 3-dehydroquinate dehydratase n=1 Tax=Brachybacterium sillae TaxID=2810536 RepID=UPI00217EB285|nr:type I 3-dehydroquinate dehydratase [Brachybacterium sillae]MCS6710588.1 type I 3-dehydroquinate dehydratase [Brachybacterium sillae]